MTENTLRQMDVTEITSGEHFSFISWTNKIYNTANVKRHCTTIYL